MKDSCRTFDLPVTGNTDELYERVRERVALSKIMPSLESHVVDQLKEICRLYELDGFSKAGNKAGLIAHIRSSVGASIPGDENSNANRSTHCSASSSATPRLAEPSLCVPQPPPAMPPMSKAAAEDKLLHGVNFQVRAVR